MNVCVLMGTQTLTLKDCNHPNFQPPYFGIASLLLQDRCNLSTHCGPPPFSSGQGGRGIEPVTFRLPTQLQQLIDGALMRSDSALSALLTVTTCGVGYSWL